MRITVTSVCVDDQEKALRFYTEKLGFVKKHDILHGESRWLTLVSPEDPGGPELALEPDANPVLDGAAVAFKKALVRNGIPFTAFQVGDLHGEWNRLRGLGVRFAIAPTDAGPVRIAVLDDTCGNLIQLFEVMESS